MKGKSLSRVRLLATPWTIAYQAPPSMGFSRPEYWSGVPLPSPQSSGLVGNSLVAWWLGTWIFRAMAQVQSLVGELRSYKLHGKKKKQTPKPNEGVDLQDNYFALPYFDDIV